MTKREREARVPTGETSGTGEMGGDGLESCFSFVAKFITPKTINIKAAQTVLASSWNLVGKVTFFSLSHKVCGCSFIYEADRNRILEKGPWTFSGAHMVLKIWDPDSTLDEINFPGPLSGCKFMCCHQITVMRRTWYTIRNFIVKFLEIDNLDVTFGRFKKLISIKILVRIKQQLRLGFFANRNPGDLVWSSFHPTVLENILAMEEEKFTFTRRRVFILNVRLEKGIIRPTTLNIWNPNHFGKVQDRIKELYDYLERIQSGPQREDFLAQEKLIQIELRELLIRETILWREKAKSKWFCEGDVETSFFHLSTAIHRRCNNINAILAPHDSLNTFLCSIPSGDEIKKSISREKSSVHYSKNVPDPLKNEIGEIRAMEKRPHNSKYLGLPFCNTRSKKQAFQEIVEKFRQILSGWKLENLSQVGIAILIQLRNGYLIWEDPWIHDLERYKPARDTDLPPHRQRVSMRHKNLIWKALGDAMPTATRMSFLPEKVANCLFCDLEVESMDHLFLICPMIKALWKAKDYWVATLKRRDSTKFKPDAVWEKPEGDWLKINFDANYDDGGIASSSCIAKDAKGDILDAWTRKENVGDFKAEASTDNFAFMVGENLVCPKLIVERDALFLINAFKGHLEFQNWNYQPLLDVSKDYLVKWPN
ncbi:hypothetical protein M9H77_21028 [Catharanthus roseus]|uniref:Uncharacterized protein n=1 Tax=Catharanthus roseus TaxID=4058 RepID=A0ACC0ALE0_CATRO|nr:hypothetical protein M9H77_21028 [Catharanthus roseus]